MNYSGFSIRMDEFNIPDIDSDVPQPNYRSIAHVFLMQANLME